MTCFLSLLHSSLLTSNLCLPVIWYHGFLPTPRAPALTQTLQGSNTTANWPLGHPWSYNTILQSLSKPVPHHWYPQGNEHIALISPYLSASASYPLLNPSFSPPKFIPNPSSSIHPHAATKINHPSLPSSLMQQPPVRFHYFTSSTHTHTHTRLPVIFLSSQIVPYHRCSW